MAGMTADAVITRSTCSNPLVVNLAVSSDISPAINTVARGFDSQHHVTHGRCVQVDVHAGDSAAVAGQIDGQDPAAGLGPVDAWIPDSSLWLDVARSYPVGAQAVQPTGISVARSPLMIVTTRAVAAKTGIFDGPVGWDLLLPPGYGGPPASLGLTVEIPDPADTSAGLATLVELSRVLGSGPGARATFTKFLYTSQSTANFDSAAGLTAFAGSAGAAGHPVVTVASEQAVLAYDRANPKAPLVAAYPTGVSPELGTPELDYPYVVTTSAAATRRAAIEFAKYLQSAYAQSVIRYNGFRSDHGTPDSMPGWTGLSSQPMQVAASPSAAEAAASLQAWEKLGLGSRVLVLTDASAAMNQPAGSGTQTLLQMVAETSVGGLALFPSSTQLGLWELGDTGSAGAAYKQLVSVGPLPAAYGVLSRRATLQAIDKQLTKARGKGTLKLNKAISAAYQYMTKHYAANYVNAVVVLTAGVDGAGDMPLSTLLSQLHALYNPSRKVAIIILKFGRAGSLTPLRQIAAATGGAAYSVTSPAEVGKVFIEAIAQRMCDQGCAAP